MSRISRKEERIAELAALVDEIGVMRLRDAAMRLGVSEMTIRRDIGGDAGRLNCLGGYIIPAQDGSSGSDYVFDFEKDSHASAKAQACAAAAALIEPHDTVFIDCGTTMPHLAHHIPQNQHITVVCYALNIAEILSQRSDVRLIVLGGLYHPEAASFSGDEAIDVLKRININKAFLSAGGVDEQHGVTCSHFHEVPIKQMAMQRAVEKHLVVDESKYGKVRAARFASIADFTSIVLG
ncbi:DeoR family deoxyribose operon repressor [Ochrobactrum daejeonense]|uniref:DeoR family deoxyribose operon repressor n=1 Tax=Brucella daejeonensis TaxID=659015 RepID=A0A7W9B1M0_9HYPH|nr:DeoR/GlpR family DNA-binding transcription regulator [Brucella daejeonensis]MBB5704346.1 DeoR family deoxyribose operon repressor [Brucella daejeonensis]